MRYYHIQSHIQRKDGHITRNTQNYMNNGELMSLTYGKSETIL